MFNKQSNKKIIINVTEISRWMYENNLTVWNLAQEFSTVFVPSSCCSRDPHRQLSRDLSLEKKKNSKPLPVQVWSQASFVLCARIPAPPCWLTTTTFSCLCFQPIKECNFFFLFLCLRSYSEVSELDANTIHDWHYYSERILKRSALATRGIFLQAEKI